MPSDIATAYLRWALIRAALARGWWLVAALYLVLVAHLSPSQLVLIGVFQGVTVLLTEVPTGVLADAVSRRLALVLAHVIMGAGMALTGLVTSFPLLVVAQCLWGLGWAVASGADVAWITDEATDSRPIDAVLTAQGRFDLVGACAGIVAFGALGAVTALFIPIVIAGTSMIVLGLAVVARWPESARDREAGVVLWTAPAAVLRQGVAVAAGDRTILLVLASTFLLNGGAEGFGRLFERRFLTLGLPTPIDPIVWFAAVGLLSAGLGATTLAVAERRVAGAGAPRRTYMLGCLVGAVGLASFAVAPTAGFAVAGALLVRGVAFPTTRVMGTVIVNRRASSPARATVHSLVSQAENGGEVVCGVLLAVIASAATPTTTLMASALLVAAAGVVVRAVIDDRSSDTIAPGH